MSEPAASLDLPYPPVELRRSVGTVGLEFFENPYRIRVFGDAIRAEQYQSVFDFGCGCGRIARQMLLQADCVPERYVGVDLYRPSVDWCVKHLSPVHPGFKFLHHDYFSAGLNPKGSKTPLPLREKGRFGLVNAHSVFTHIVEDHVAHYFEQVSALVDQGGALRVTWFLFDKQPFPMMQSSQNSLYINITDPSNAVIYDIEFVKQLYRNAGLNIYRIEPPGIRGHQWLVYASRGLGHTEVEFPRDEGTIGTVRPPVTL
jgi:SAM-dependent methyltransferase